MSEETSIRDNDRLAKDFDCGLVQKTRSMWDDNSKGRPWSSLLYSEKHELCRKAKEDWFAGGLFTAEALSFTPEVIELARKRREKLCDLSPVFTPWSSLYPGARLSLCHDALNQSREEVKYNPQLRVVFPRPELSKMDARLPFPKSVVDGAKSVWGELHNPEVLWESLSFSEKSMICSRLEASKDDILEPSELAAQAVKPCHHPDTVERVKLRWLSSGPGDSLWNSLSEAKREEIIAEEENAEIERRLSNEHHPSTIDVAKGRLARLTRYNSSLPPWSVLTYEVRAKLCSEALTRQMDAEERG